MTRVAFTPGAGVAYVAPDGISYPARVLFTRSAGFVRVHVPDLRDDVDVHQKWLSDLTPQEQARLRRDGAVKECRCDCVNCVTENHDGCYYRPSICPFFREKGGES